MEKWIQGAVPPSHKGLLHKKLGVPQGKPIPEGKLQGALNSQSPTLRHEAQFAANMKGVSKKPKIKSINDIRAHVKMKGY